MPAHLLHAHTHTHITPMYSIKHANTLAMQNRKQLTVAHLVEETAAVDLHARVLEVVALLQQVCARQRRQIVTAPLLEPIL